MFHLKQAFAASFRLAALTYQRSSSQTHLIRTINTTAPRHDINEFFEPEENWPKREIRSGKEWSPEELRLKSNVDLWKLWFVLYKERNMLETMKAEYERLKEAFPNPERVFKVELSMQNLESVVAERNRAYNLVEHGVTGEPPVDERYSGIGLKYYRRYEEHLVPYWMNKKHHFARRVRDPFLMSSRQADFLIKYWERQRRDRRREVKADRRYLRRVRSMYPNSKVWEKIGERYKASSADVFHSKMSD